MSLLARAASLAAAAAVLVAPPAFAAPAPPPELPDPTYQSVAKEVLVEMDDGVKLGTTVTFPSLDGETPAPGQFPVVLSMTPYGRNGLGGVPSPALFATRGMISAVADVRGTGGSGGNLDGNYFSPREARDGYELVEYFGTQPYSNGRVGMAGGSYVGITQYLTAEQQPPHLAAIAPQVAISDLYREGYTHGGIPNLFFDAQYIAVQGAPGTLGPNTDPALLADTIAAKLGQSAPGTIAFDYLKRPDDDAFYRDRSPIYNARAIEVPTLILGGWNDGLLRGSPEMYRVLSKRKGVETRMRIDPCTHKGCGPPLAPLTNPPDVGDVSAYMFEFLAKYLSDAPAPRRPPVEYYVQGANHYATARTWPPRRTRLRRYRLGSGALRPPRAEAATATESYVSNPLAGLSMALDKYGTVAISPYVPLDQRLEGPNGLTFRTDPLAGPLTVAGPLALHLVAASSATDTDWYAKLSDVAPDGSEKIFAEGALRASHRAVDPKRSLPGRPYHTHTDPQPIEPGRYYPYDVEIWPTAYQLAPGHRLQLRVTSSDLPTHFPGHVSVDVDDPGRVVVEPFGPTTNTLPQGQSKQALPVSAASP
jgi:putative CocE/NonD family hydrolase